MSDKPWTTFALRYYYQGSWWGLEIQAANWEDAEARAKKLGCQLDGEVVMKIPANAGGSFLAPAITWFRNLFTP